LGRSPAKADPATPGKPRNASERSERHLKWRTGCEGRTSHLKRNHGWDRSMIDSTEGVRIWTGHGVLAHNLAKIAALTA
jgi:IS5 family transposase